MYFSYAETNLKNDFLRLFKKEVNFSLENNEDFTRQKLSHDLANLLNTLS